MDPRHPELALVRLKELIKQYDNIEKRMSTATTTAQLSQAEREGGLVVQEMCLVAPRLHEALIQTSRNRRYDLSHGVVVDMSKYEIPEGAIAETYVAPNQAETVIVEPNYKKKKKSKKKKAE